MARVVHATVVNRPLGEVFAFVSDLSRHPAYGPQIPSSPPTTLAAFDPPAGFTSTWAVAGDSYVASWSFAALSPLSTSAVEVLEVHTTGLRHLLESFTLRHLQSQVSLAHSRIRAALEAGISPALPSVLASVPLLALPSLS
jgi:hypothetical protein